MRIERADASLAKGWYAGPWNSDLAICVGYANAAINEPHVHARVTEIFLVARGSSAVRVELETMHLQTGDMIVIEPGEAHTFLESSPDYLHFVVHTPGLPPGEAQADKSTVSPSRLGL